MILHLITEKLPEIVHVTRRAVIATTAPENEILCNDR
jgi:hypothetical protein